jgi:hypothetical protein
MKFSEVVAQSLAWLRREGRVSYRALKREFDLDDEYIEDLKVELYRLKGRLTLQLQVQGSRFNVQGSRSRSVFS